MRIYRTEAVSENAANVSAFMISLNAYSKLRKMTLSLLLLLVNCRIEALKTTWELPDGCLSETEANTCHTNCDVHFKDCIKECNHNISCAEGCINEDEACTASCPCFENCPGGCPCPYYTVWCPDRSCQKEHEVSFNYCVNDMEDKFIECGLKCDPFDLTCHQSCASEYNNDLKKCPCGELCQDGCQNGKCPEWNCHGDEPPSDHDDIHLLILNPSDSSTPKSKQIKVSIFDKDIEVVEQSHEVELEKHRLFETSRGSMCSFVNKGKMYLAGSSDSPASEFKTRLGQIDGNTIVYFDDMKKEKIEFAYGLCTGDVGPNNHALLCSPITAKKTCWKWDGKHNGSWVKLKDTKEVHYKSGVAKRHYKQKTCNKSEKSCSPETVHAIIFGGRDDKNGYTERLMEKKGNWEWTKNYDNKFSGLKHNHFFSTVTFENKVYAFGGLYYQGKDDGGKITNKVFVYNQKWSNDRPLALARARHQSVIVGERIVHVGGSGEYPFEIWTSYGKGHWVDPIFKTKMTLNNWSKNPNVFAVGADDYE